MTTNVGFTTTYKASVARGALLLALSVLLCVFCFVLTGCGGGSQNYKDGTYTGQSSVYEDAENNGEGNGYGVATITITDGKISACDFKTYEPDGTLKDENYGKSNGATYNQDFYNKAQKAVAANTQYAEKLVSVGNADGVDAVSGATISYNEFQDAVADALSQAAE